MSLLEWWRMVFGVPVFLFVVLCSCFLRITSPKPAYTVLTHIQPGLIPYQSKLLRRPHVGL